MFIRLVIKDKSFTQKVIFKDAEIKIKDGEFIGIIGESGIGKSTLLKMIGLLEPYVGEYYLNNQLINKKERNTARIAHFSYLFQDALLIPYLNVRDNVILPLKNLKQPIDENKLDEILKRLNIYDLKYSSVINLSGGESTRVAIARSIIVDRDIIIADEPTGNLDNDNALVVLNILKEENEKGKTVIMVTHSLQFSSFFSRIIKIQDKKIK